MHKRPVLAPLLVLCILFSTGPAKHAAAAERLAFSPPLVSSDTAGLAATVGDIIDRAAEVMPDHSVLPEQGEVGQVVVLDGPK